MSSAKEISVEAAITVFFIRTGRRFHIKRIINKMALKAFSQSDSTNFVKSLNKPAQWLVTEQ